MVVSARKKSAEKKNPDYVKVYKYQWKSMFQAVKFDLVRVDSPLGLVINGKKANTEFQAGIQLSTFTKSDWFKLITLVTM